MVMKIYGALSFNVQRAILPLFEAGVDFEQEVQLVKMDFFSGELKQPSFLAKQPFGQVPYLEDAGVHIFESRAIARYLADKYQGQGVPLLGKTRQEKALVLQWTEVESQQFNPVAAPLLREYYLAPIFERPVNEEVVVPLVEKLVKVLDIYEAHLSKTKYLAGDNYTLADAFHSPSVNFLKAFRGDLFESREHLLAWAEDITARPAFVKTLETNSKW